MTTVEPCDHGALYPLEPCGPCSRGGEPPELSDRLQVAVGPQFEAAHTTTCPACSFDVAPGQAARMISRSGRPARAHHAGACVREAVKEGTRG